MSHRTLQRFEAQDGIPDNRLGNLEVVERTLSELGVLFSGDPVNSPGVQLKRELDQPANGPSKF